MSDAPLGNVWIACSFIPGLIAATIHVPTDQPTIQAAINKAANGDDIIVAAGTYHELINFGGKSVHVQSASGPASTIIDGGAAGAVVSFTTNEGSGAIIDGFTIQNGAPGTRSLDEGGGITIEGSSPTIENNIIQNNHVGYAGGGIGIGTGSPSILNNIIRGNSQNNGIGGGGISTRGGSPLIQGNTIVDNQATAFGGGLAFWAAGQPTIIKNTIMGNTGADAGGISFVNGGTPLVEENLIVGNTGTGAGGISGLLGSVVNNTIADNKGPQGSAISGFFGTGVILANNILTAPDGQNLVGCSGNTIQPDNNLLFAPGGQIVSGSCQSWIGVNGNLNADPLFICPSGGNYRLQPGSPAIDSGDNSALSLTADLDGSPRVVNGIIDMGAYEFQGPSMLSLSVNTLVFPDTIVGTSSALQPVVISNIGTRKGSFCAELAGSDFTMSSNCGDLLDPGASCSLGLTFSPMQQGTRTGTVTVPSDSANSPAVVTLSGTGFNPAPVLSSIAPNQAVVSGPAFTLQVVGSNFVSTSVVQWNGANQPTSFVSSTVLTASIPSSDLAKLGTAQVQVVSGGPGGGTTSALAFTVLGPMVTSGGLVNGASYTAQVSPGSYVALFGSNLASASVSASSVPLPTTLGHVSVLMNGFAAPLFFVSSTQINLQVPWELTGTGSVQIIVTTNGVSAPPMQASLTSLAPGLLTVNQQGTGQGAILIAGTGQLASAAEPVNRTDAVSIYCVGLGAVSNPPPSGSPVFGSALAQTLATPTVAFGGVEGTLLFSGLAPGFVVLYQVNVRLPLNAPAGPTVPVALNIGGVASNTVTIGVQ